MSDGWKLNRKRVREMVYRCFYFVSDESFLNEYKRVDVYDLYLLKLVE